MKTLVCAATWEELRTFGNVPTSAPSGLARQDDQGFLVTGVGVPAALASVLEAARTECPERILNIGIAGAYPGQSLDIADLVIGDSEIYGDVGLELPEAPYFQPLTETPFGGPLYHPLPLTPLPGHAETRRGRGCTVSTCTGTEAVGRRRAAQCAAIFETMEGAAVAQAGMILGIAVSEVRAISNIAAHREMRPENIRRALETLMIFFQEHAHA